MNKSEIAVYLGLPSDANIREEIVRSMADVPVPSTDEEHIAAFRAFLASGVKPARGHQLEEGR